MRVSLCVYFLPLYPLLRAQMVEGERSHVPGFTNKSSSFSFRSPQNINGPPCNQFSTNLRPGTSPPFNFLSMFCTLAPFGTLCILGVESVVADLLARILMDHCLCVALKWPLSLSVRTKFMYFFLLLLCASNASIKGISLIRRSLTPVA